MNIYPSISFRTPNPEKYSYAMGAIGAALSVSPFGQPKIGPDARMSTAVICAGYRTLCEALAVDGHSQIRIVCDTACEDRELSIVQDHLDSGKLDCKGVVVIENVEAAHANAIKAAASIIGWYMNKDVSPSEWCARDALYKAYSSIGSSSPFNLPDQKWGQGVTRVRLLRPKVDVVKVPVGRVFSRSQPSEEETKAPILPRLVAAASAVESYIPLPAQPAEDLVVPVVPMVPMEKDQAQIQAPVFQEEQAHAHAPAEEKAQVLPQEHAQAQAQPQSSQAEEQVQVPPQEQAPIPMSLVDDIKADVDQMVRLGQKINSSLSIALGYEVRLTFTGRRLARIDQRATRGVGQDDAWTW